MKSYPASCDFLVARPPTYNESIENIRRTKNNNITQIKYVYVYPIQNKKTKRKTCTLL